MGSARLRAVALAVTCLLNACATTGGSPGAAYQPAPIPEGKGRLTLEAGGINQLNFYIVDEKTGDEVYEDTPRVSSRSPSAYDSGAEAHRLTVDLDPGTYTVVVNTDIDDDVEVEGVIVQMGQEIHVPVRVGRFQVQFQGGDQFGSQMPFLILDYNMRTVLGKGMTSSEVRRFIVPEGHYKIRIEHSPSGFDVHRPVDVSFGRITQVFIGAEQPTETTQPQGQPQEP